MALAVGMLEAVMLLLFFTLVLAQQPTAAKDFVLAKGRAGGIEVGMTADALLTLASGHNAKLVDLQLEGFFSPALVVSSAPGRRMVVAEVSEHPCGNFRVFRLTVEDPRFKTNAGIGVGSTYAQLRRAHKTERGANGEGGLTVFAPELEMSFGFAEWHERLTELPDAAKIIDIGVILSPDEVRKARCPQLGSIR